MESQEPADSLEQQEGNPYFAPRDRSRKASPDPTRLAGAMLWVVVALIVGGLLAGYVVGRFGELGLIVVWPIGWGAGFVAAKILRGKSRAVGGLLIIACFGIALLAEVHWIQTNIKDADDSWLKAFTLLPAFAAQFQFAAFTAICMSVFGAISAWQQVAVRYVRVRVDD